MSNANMLARSLCLGDDDKHILTADENRCLIGTPGQRSPDQDTIVECIADLTNSNGDAGTPLSSYGLSLANPLEPSESLVRSVGAPHAPCLRFNKLIAGPLEDITRNCGFLDKLARLFVETPIVRFGVRGYDCQSSSIVSSEGACMAESIRRR